MITKSARRGQPLSFWEQVRKLSVCSRWPWPVKIGVAAYLTKPVRQSDLFDCLALVLAGEAAKQPAHALVTKHSIAELRRANIRILLVEDNEVNQQVAIGLLKKLGQRADIARNGAEAITALTERDYDLVFMDMQMPVMDGMEATARIRDPASGVRNHRVTIIAMTANAMQGDREKCLASGMDDYIAKPVTVEALNQMIRKWAPHGHQAEQPAAPETAVVVPAPEPAMPSIPVFDRLRLMERLMDDEDLARTVLQGYLQEIPRRLSALEAALVSGNAEDAMRESHTIKGMAANVGGEALRQIAYGMEKAAGAGNVPDAAAKLAELKKQIELLNEAVLVAQGQVAGSGGMP